MNRRAESSEKVEGSAGSDEKVEGSAGSDEKVESSAGSYRMNKVVQERRQQLGHYTFIFPRVTTHRPTTT